MENTPRVEGVRVAGGQHGHRARAEDGWAGARGTRYAGDILGGGRLGAGRGRYGTLWPGGTLLGGEAVGRAGERRWDAAADGGRATGGYGPRYAGLPGRGRDGRYGGESRGAATGRGRGRVAALDAAAGTTAEGGARGSRRHTRIEDGDAEKLG
ncbi:spidroin-1-like [Dioscorea cayenensis subsp. rotundata]|uniref:Spidroin-1-like n=1 Tax=Dioscorea cayennensis subsp. rotundata TaxID=55577 RepID=A0AB40CC87_DIOCR|nr:spidroin-1-like [Dioscorea cayenensis subsp. rotundata]